MGAGWTLRFVTWLSRLAVCTATAASCGPSHVTGPVPSAADLKGLQSGWVVDAAPDLDSGYQVLFDKYPAILSSVVALGARWYRLEFRVPPAGLARARRRREARGQAAECGTQCSAQDLGWDEALLDSYDRAVQSLRARKLEILGLISTATVLAPQAERLANSGELTGRDGDNAFVAHLGSVVFPLLLRRYGDRIHVWEIGNEPDVWTLRNPYALTGDDLASGKLPGGSFMFPSNFAQLLRRTFEAARAAEQAGAPPIRTVSGGLLAMNAWKDEATSPGGGRGLFRNSAGGYLHAFVKAGFAHAGWGAIMARYHRLPIEGWGLHLYVHQETPHLALDPWTNFGRYVAAFQSMTQQLSAKHLGPGKPGLPIWVTELGFGTTLGTIPAEARSDSVRSLYWSYQAEGLELAYQCLAQLRTGAPVFWFTLFDIPHAQIESGLFTPVWRTPEFAPLTPKPAAARYLALGTGGDPGVDCRRTSSGVLRGRVECKLTAQPIRDAPGEPVEGECREL